MNSTDAAVLTHLIGVISIIMIKSSQKESTGEVNYWDDFDLQRSMFLFLMGSLGWPTEWWTSGGWNSGSDGLDEMVVVGGSWNL